MSYLKDYIKNYGDTTFTAKGFTDADNVAMCYMYYMPIEKVVSSSLDDQPMPFDEVCNKLFALRGNKHQPVGLILTKDISVQTMNMASKKRYAQMKVVGATDVFGQEPAVQFNAATFLLPDGTIVVMFRGTDDTLVGWKEDFDILFKESIPSHKLATEYLEAVAEKFKGDIIVCGHSKGGYVAQYGALFCKKEVRDRIVRLYNNDGPGFQSYDYLSTDAYKEMLPKYRHFVPQSSLIGMMLCHDDDYTVVRSKRISGPLQHDLSTWQFNGDKLKIENDLSPLGKVNDLMMYNLVSNLSPEQSKAFDTVLTKVIDGGKAVGLLDIKDDIIDTVKDGKVIAESFDEKTQKDFESVMPSLRAAIKNAGKDVQNGNFKTVKERINNQ
ncbi:MAG: Mbeg1-like protein [Eubacterium sp.]